jgi:hypothetical protein
MRQIRGRKQACTLPLKQEHISVTILQEAFTLAEMSLFKSSPLFPEKQEGLATGRPVTF